MKRQEMSESKVYLSEKSFHTSQPSRLSAGLKKYGLVGGGILAVIMAALFVLAFQVALIVSGVMLVAAAVIAAYIYLVKKF
jgi:uncharacterized membrane protein